MRPPKQTASCFLSSMGFELSPVEHDLRQVADDDCLQIPVEGLRGGLYQVRREGRTVYIRPLSGPFLGELEQFILQFFARGECVLSLPEADEEAAMSVQQWDELWKKNPTNIVFIAT